MITRSWNKLKPMNRKFSRSSYSSLSIDFIIIVFLLSMFLLLKCVFIFNCEGSELAAVAMVSTVTFLPSLPFLPAHCPHTLPSQCTPSAMCRQIVLLLLSVSGRSVEISASSAAERALSEHTGTLNASSRTCRKSGERE